MSSPALRAARENDVEAVRTLLSECDLPVDGLEFAFPAGFVVAGTARIIGCAGIEVYDDIGLLRSVAVDLANRAKGVGRALVLDRIAEARRVGLEALYALTTSAPAFFTQHGFEPLDRNSVHASLHHSSEFATVCPTSALVLRHPLRR